MRPLARLLLAVFCLAAPPVAAELAGLPGGARLAAEDGPALANVALPVGPWRSGGAEMLSLEGRVSREAWQIAGSDLSTFQLLAPLRDGLAAEGFDVVAECAARACGGFEFRYAMDLLPEPEMHVDLGDYRYTLMARGTGDLTEHVALMVSRTADRGFVHVTRIRPPSPVSAIADIPEDRDGATGAPRPGSRGEGPDATPMESDLSRPINLADSLERSGHAVLSDLTFETGSSRLADREFASLTALADWLAENPGTSVVLVGHTDTDGTLANNIALSRKRAEAVGARLRAAYGIAGSRLAAEGVGYLAPLVSNATEEGRGTNRRVEVVVVGGG